METGVGEESCDLRKYFAFLEGRGLITPLSPHVFQFDRELGEGFGEVLHA